MYKHFELQSFYKSRENYGDIGFSFYKILAKTLLEAVNGSEEILAQLQNLELLGTKIDLEDKEIKNEILSD